MVYLDMNFDGTSRKIERREREKRNAPAHNLAKKRYKDLYPSL